MCRFFALAVREKKLAKELLSQFVVWDNNNQTLARTIPKGYTWLWITDGHCSCDLTTSISQLESEIVKVRNKLKLNHQKGGWNKNKVEAKVEQIQRIISTYPGGLNAPLYQALKNLVKQQGPCFFYVISVSGNPDHEAFSILGAEDFELIGDTSKQPGINDNILFRMR